MKISELDTAALADIKEAGYVPAITAEEDGATVRVALSEFAAASDLDSSITFTSSDSSLTVTETETSTGRTIDISIASSDETSTAGKVAVDSESDAGYLEDIIVSDSDALTILNVSGQLRLSLNLELTSDPKIETCHESQINTASSNYGSYTLSKGYERIVWDDPSSVTYVNAMVYQMERLSQTQGTITKVNMAVTGSVTTTDPPACFAAAIFDSDGVKLGETGLLFYGEDWDNNSFVSFDISEATTGSLSIDRNTRYIMQLWSCGVQFAALDRDTSNYTYDFTLRQNLQGAATSPSFVSVTDTTLSAAATIPYISFGAEALN